ncbi:hypothetical protein PENTCL1PPCAC_8338, partial [Pristionchus entomophagus]
VSWTLRLADSHTAHINARVLFRDSIVLVFFHQPTKTHLSKIKPQRPNNTHLEVELAADALRPLTMQAERLKRSKEFTSANLISMRDTITRSVSLNQLNFGK